MVRAELITSFLLLILLMVVFRICLIEKNHSFLGPLRGAKGQIYEGGHRIPFMIRWDNGAIPAGETRSHLVGLNDVYATLCQLAGITKPLGQGIDSLSFADYISNSAKTSNLRKTLGTWAIRNGLLMEEAIRKDNLKLILYRHEQGAMGLFDLHADISETRNLISKESYKQDVDEMLATLKDISPCSDSNGNFPVSTDSGTQQRTCKWFQSKRERCKLYYEGQVYCRLTCAGYNSRVCSVTPYAAPSTYPSISPLPTQTPSTAPTCSDSTESFTININGIEKETTCEWFREWKKRCDNHDEGRERCAVSCGFGCPVTDAPSTAPTSSHSPSYFSSPSPSTYSDNPGKFVILQKGVEVRVNCKWFSKRPKFRCKNYAEGRKECKTTCQVVPLKLTPAPSPAPPTPPSSPSSPTSSCWDSTNQFIIWNNGVKNEVTCEFFRESKEDRCASYKLGRQKCRKTCDGVNRPGRFPVVDKSGVTTKRSCGWFAQKKKYRCNNFSEGKVECSGTCGSVCDT